MLVLTRRPGEAVEMTGPGTIIVLSQTAGAVRLGFIATRSTDIRRINDPEIPPKAPKNRKALQCPSKSTR